MAWKLSKSDKKNVPIDEIFAKAEREQNHESDNMTKCLESETVEIVRSAVNNLDEKYRAVVVLYYFNGFSVKEIANAALKIRIILKLGFTKYLQEWHGNFPNQIKRMFQLMKYLQKQNGSKITKATI